MATTLLQFGPIRIEWNEGPVYPIAVDHARLNGACALVTLTAITYRRGQWLTKTVPEGFHFDGASIPIWFWFVPGFAPLGKHVWAALLHDELCELAKTGEFDREIADGVFAALLRHTGVDGWRGVAMDLAVAGYRRWNAFRKWWDG